VKGRFLVSAVAAVAVGVMLFASTRPDTFRVERSILIAAPAERIFPLIDDFRQWAAWSPYERLDPAMKRNYSGAASGRGAAYAWEGSGKVGAGRMEIAQSTPPSKVSMRLDFAKPFEAHNIADFTLEPQGGTTRVTWAMQGPSPFLSKVMQVFLDMDTMIGKDFEDGLANLKAVSEKKGP
jgi:uncharacterized protein YndB with AHSA1/START domain